jgi:hypothetical protein
MTARGRERGRSDRAGGAVLAIALSLGGCGTAFVGASRDISIADDGSVDCVDSMALPIVASAMGAMVTAAALYMWRTDPVDAFFGVVGAVDGAVLGRHQVRRCREAKQRGALIAQQRARADARQYAVALWKRAMPAARANDCDTVHELGREIREIDLELHVLVFSHDAAIARCLAPAPMRQVTE